MDFISASSGNQSQSADAKHRCRRALNPRAAVILLCLAVGCTLAVRRLHSRQFEKTVQFVRTSAMAAAENQDASAAIVLLNQYLSMRHSDMEALETMSRLLEQQEGDPRALERAFQINEDLLRDNTPLPDLRLRQARIAMRLRRYSDAEVHLKILQSALPNSSEVWMLSAQAALAMRHPTEADRLLKTAIRCPDPDPAAYAALVNVAIHLNADREDLDITRRLMDEMILKIPTPDARAERASWLMAHQEYGAALEDIWTGLQGDAHHQRLNDLLVHCCQRVVADRVELDSDPLAAAVEHFQKLAEQSDTVRPHLQLATVLWLAGSRQETLDVLEDGIRKLPRAYALHRLLVEYLVNADQPQRARELLSRLPGHALTPTERSYLQARLLMADNQWTEATDLLNQAIAFADAGSEILPRARVALAMAQQHRGHTGATRDLYESALTSDPHSTSSRLGIAASLVASDDLERAIAEYEQVSHLPGVAAYMISLMIEHNLQRPAVLRRWDDVQQALDHHRKNINDDVQVTLLQADLNLARGRVADVLQQLDTAIVRYPHSTELANARTRLRGELSSDLADRLLRVLQADATNAEVHAALLTLFLADADSQRATEWVHEILQGSRIPGLAPGHARHVLVRAMQLTRQWEISAGRTDHLDWLQEQIVMQSRALAGTSPQRQVDLIRNLALLGRVSDSLDEIDGMAASSADQAALACLELVRFSTDRGATVPQALSRIQTYIRAAPADMALRTAYAEVLLYGDDLDAAAQVLAQVTTYDDTQATALARLAWIQAAATGRPPSATLSFNSEESSATALPAGTQALSSPDQLVQQAIRLQPHDPSIQAMALRVLLAQQNFAAIRDNCEQSARQQTLSTTALLYWAVALHELQQTEQARSVSLRLQQQLPDDPLLPADTRLLRLLVDTLQESATASR